VNLAEVIRIAFRALGRNKMRTLLTMLGIIIGVGAVICTVAIGQGATVQVQEQIRNLGDNMLFIMAGSVNQGGVHLGSQATKTLTLEDAQAIQQQISTITRISPMVSASAQVVYGNQNWFTRVQGVSPEYLQIRRWPLSEGGVFSQRDVDVAADVCLIGQTVAQNLFGGEDPVGQTIRVRNIPFLIVGELAQKGQSPFGQDEDDTLLMPYTTVQKKIAGIDWLQSIMCSTAAPEDMFPAQQQIASLLRQRHKLRPDEADDFIIRNPTDLANAQAQTGRVMTLLLGSIAYSHWRGRLRAGPGADSQSGRQHHFHRGRKREPARCPLGQPSNENAYSARCPCASAAGSVPHAAFARSGRGGSSGVRESELVYACPRRLA